MAAITTEVVTPLLALIVLQQQVMMEIILVTLLATQMPQERTLILNLVLMPKEVLE